MILKGWIPALGLFVLAATWSGCSIFMADQPPSQYTCVDDEIRIGDTLTISLLDIPEPKTDSFLVGGDGTVNLPLLGSIVATNKKFGAFEKEIQKAYLDKKMYRQVTVVVKPGDRFYTVGGEVNSKGRQIYVGQTTVVRAIVSCGDFTEFANRRRVEILRANGTREIIDCIKARKDHRFDRPICPGDAIIVPRSL
jgi:protein involved in polysaccharide export with SLBB domain